MVDPLAQNNIKQIKDSAMETGLICTKKNLGSAR